ncbi:MAG: cytochrome C oxidase subunit IV family protein [Chloroflexota bacterium]
MAHAHNSHTPAEHHPGPALYIKIGIILAVLTAIEVAVFYFDLPQIVMMLILLTLSAAKFVLVVSYFMHLKFDDSRFTWLFVIPFALMVVVGIALLALFFHFTA